MVYIDLIDKKKQRQSFQKQMCWHQSRESVYFHLVSELNISRNTTVFENTVNLVHLFFDSAPSRLSSMLLSFKYLSLLLLCRNKGRRKKGTLGQVWLFFIAGISDVIGKPRVNKYQDSQMSTDSQHIVTPLHPEATNVLKKSPEKACAERQWSES